jgi:hypothetical protein
MEKVNNNKIGLIFGLLMAIGHLIWALLVWIGLAQRLLDWIFSLHFIVNPYILMAFNFWKMILLIIITFIVGYIIGWILAALINWLHKK